MLQTHHRTLLANTLPHSASVHHTATNCHTLPTHRHTATNCHILLTYHHTLLTATQCPTVHHTTVHPLNLQRKVVRSLHIANTPLHITNTHTPPPRSASHHSTLHHRRFCKLTGKGDEIPPLSIFVVAHPHGVGRVGRVDDGGLTYLERTVFRAPTDNIPATRNRWTH